VFDNVVVGATDSAGGIRALRRAIAVVRASGGTLHIVTALGRRQPRLPEASAELRRGTGVGPAGSLLAKLRDMAVSESVRVQTHPAYSDAAAAITRVAAEENADLIVVGSKVSNGTRQLAHVPKAVMDRAACPVLVV
jgi:nucleotide-binding universal stress UspA family protein